MIAEFSVMPVDKGESIGKWVSKAVAVVCESGVSYKLTPMGTIVEGHAKDVFALIQKCHEVVMRESNRVVTRIVIDDRKGVTDGLKKKVAAIEKYLGRTVNQ